MSYHVRLGPLMFEVDEDLMDELEEILTSDHGATGSEHGI